MRVPGRFGNRGVVIGIKTGPACDCDPGHQHETSPQARIMLTR